ncbi:PLAC8 family protein [Aspergillus pseudoustus]|uniref:PLAC8 family protein n=1 Tax=Aspergillus pseudoustus TaxID=1810923 RepID=A0ABR4JWV1_9EURO
MSAYEKTYRSTPTAPPAYGQDVSTEARNITHNRHWNHSLCDCCSPGTLCLLTCCLPCLTFGKTQARSQDPTLQNYSSINSECLIFGFLSLGYFQWIIQTIRRGEMREKHGIEGSCCGDCCATFWCGCCTLVQEEKEMELRTRPELTGYKSTPQMAYP